MRGFWEYMLLIIELQMKQIQYVEIISYVVLAIWNYCYVIQGNEICFTFLVDHVITPSSN